MITETCQINRSTFYRNYEDKYSLIAQVACRLLEEYQTALQPDFIILTDPDIVRLRPYFLPLIEFCNKNQRALSVLWDRELPVNLFESMLPLYSKQLLAVLERHHRLTGHALDIASYFSQVVASDVLITIRWWYKRPAMGEEADFLQLLTSIITASPYQNIQREFSDHCCAAGEGAG